MTLGILFLCAGILSFLSFMGKPNVLLSIAAAGMWIACLSFMVYQPLPLLPAGSTSQEIVLIALGGASMGVLLAGIIRSTQNRSEKNAEIDFYMQSDRPSETPKNFRAYMTARQRANDSDHIETEQEYKAKIHRKLNPREARK